MILILANIPPKVNHGIAYKYMSAHNIPLKLTALPCTIILSKLSTRLLTFPPKLTILQISLPRHVRQKLSKTPLTHETSKKLTEQTDPITLKVYSSSFLLQASQNCGRNEKLATCQSKKLKLKKLVK